MTKLVAEGLLRLGAADVALIRRRIELEQTRWSETLTAMQSVAQGKVVSGDDVHAWLASWGSSGELPPPKAEKRSGSVIL